MDFPGMGEARKFAKTVQPASPVSPPRKSITSGEEKIEQSGRRKLPQSFKQCVDALMAPPSAEQPTETLLTRMANIQSQFVSYVYGDSWPGFQASRRRIEERTTKK